MKSFDSDIKKYADKVRLKAAERRRLRERVVAYMEYHPLPKKKGMPVDTLSSQPFVIFSFNNSLFKAVIGSFAILVLILIPIFAERSVPGDVLYLVKTEINEGIQSQFANSPYEKVAFETKLIERRIAEARLLAEEGKLTEEVEAEIAETVKNHASAAQQGLAQLREANEDDAAIAAITFDSALDIQSAVLDTNTSETATSSVNTIKSVVKNVREEVGSRRASSTPSFSGFLARIELETTRAYELYESVKDSATEEERKNIERRFSDIERKIAGAKQDESRSENIRELASALGLIQRLVVYMTDIDVRKNVPLDRLVPVELTPEERTVILDDALATATVRIRAVETKVPHIENENVREKVELGLGEIKAGVASATSSLESGDIGSAEAALGSVQALIDDIESLTASVVMPSNEIIEDETPDAEAISDENGTTTDPAEVPVTATGTDEVNVE